MVRDHAVVHIASAIRLCIGGMGRGLNQAAHQVGVVNIVRALQQRADPLQPHAGINAGLGEVQARAIFLLVILHENEVPDFDKPVAIFVLGARRATPDLVAMVIENFGARAAGTGRAH